MVSSRRGFPRNLLKSGQTERLEYFRSKTVSHPKLTKAYESALHAILHGSQASLILLYGPSGVGKTTMRHRLYRELFDIAKPQMTDDPGHIPVVSVEAVSPDSGNFNWKDYYKRALLALHEPLVDKKRKLSPREEIKLPFRKNTVAPELRLSLENCLRHRKPSAFIIDEAQHFKKMTSGRRLLDQMDSIKSLAELTGVKHVLIGTYELLGLADLSAQLNRRSVDIHFPRYKFDDTDDLNAFRSVLLTFQKHLPVREEPDLLENYQYIYEHSAGCVGILKEWLYRALAAAVEQDKKTVSRDLLESHALPDRKLIRISREISEGESALSAHSHYDLRRMLGISNTDDNGTREAATTAGKRKSQKRVGKRNAVRDPVGRAQYA